MFSLLWTFFDNILYYLALASLFVGALLYFLSYFARILPIVATYALMMQIIGIVLCFLGVYYVADHHGYQRRVVEDQVEIDRLNGEARAKETQLDKQKQATNVALRKAKDAINQKQSDINKRIDSGELRLSTSSCLQTNADAGTTRGSGGGGQGESDRQVIRDIVQIASEGDKAITERNACIDFYNAVRSKVNEVGK
jgi:hypothetical protein